MPVSIPTMEEMLKAGLHFGHKASNWHPKMKPYIYYNRKGMQIIDLKKTQTKLSEACIFASNVVSNGGNILFVGTKMQAQPIIEKYAKQAGMPYIKGRWMGGLLTNFGEVKKTIKRYLDLKQQKAAGGWEKYTKKEQVGLQKEVAKLDSIVSGITKLEDLPKAMYVVDIRHEKTAVREAKVKGIPIIAITDTNTDPSKVTFPIPANDDATKGIELITRCIVKACEEGAKKKKIVPATPKKDVKKAEEKKAPGAKKTFKDKILEKIS